MKDDGFFKPGDIIFSDHMLYKHYGVYVGNGRVIHYKSKNGDFGTDIGICETSLKQFADGGKCKLAYFSENRSGARQYSAGETIRRARSRIGEKRYNLLFNNCEHFALWCKYGTNKSYQVEKAFTAAVAIATAAAVAHIVKSHEEG